jgi:hypothetical protein
MKISPTGSYIAVDSKRWERIEGKIRRDFPEFFEWCG